jgi:hypothetical protein
MNRLLPLLSASLLVALAACTQESSSPAPSSASAPAAANPALDAYYAATPPADAKPVLEVKKSAAAGDQVVVKGRAKDFVAGRAMVTIVDPSLRACSDPGDAMGDECTTPWDYCCIESDEVAASSATIEIRDAAGIVKGDLRGFHGLDHLDTVTVSGTVEKDEAGNMTVVAKNLHVEKAPAK